MSKKTVGEKTLAQYNSLLLARYQKQNRKGYKTFREFMQWVKTVFSNEVFLRNWLGLKGGRIADYPELAREYSDRNKLPATQVLAGTNRSLWWKCSKKRKNGKKCGWEWLARGSHRVRGVGCPACKNLVVTPWNNLAATHPELAREYSEKNKIPADQVTLGTKKSLWWKCSKKRKDGKACAWLWKTTADNRVRHGHGCPACSGRVATPWNNLAATHPKLAGEYSIRNRLPATHVVAGTGKVLWWKCHNRTENGRICGWEWQATGNNRVRGLGCPACSRSVVTPWNNLAATHPELAWEYSEKNKIPATQVMAGTNKTLWWKCGKCRFEWQTTGHNRVRNHGGCPACRNRTVTSWNNLAATHPELAREYSPRNELPVDKVVAGTGKLLWWVCGMCKHEWRTTGNNRVRGTGCPMGCRRKRKS